MIRLTTKTMTKAIERAKAAHPRVRVINADARTYAVTGSKGDVYTVRFAVVKGLKLAECDCPAKGICYHIAAAASINIAVQSMRKQTPAPAPAPARRLSRKPRALFEASNMSTPAPASTSRNMTAGISSRRMATTPGA